MNPNTGIFLLMLSISAAMGSGLALLAYRSKGAAEAFDIATGGLVSFSGTAAGSLIVWVIFAFLSGKFTR